MRPGGWALERPQFVDSFGYSEKNRTTPREFAAFCRFYLKNHPEALEELHILTEQTYPQEQNIPPGGSSTYGPITQYNHNNLVGSLEGVDGLKTGYIDEAGYNLAVTAEREGRRLLAVLMGGPGRDSREGSLTRTVDATALISYGYYATRTFRPIPPEIPQRRGLQGQSPKYWPHHRRTAPPDPARRGGGGPDLGVPMGGTPGGPP